VKRPPRERNDRKREGMMIGRALALVALVGTAAAVPARAETYPSRPIQFVVPFTAGNAIDIIGRAFADAFKNEIGGTVVVINRDGAAGMIAMGFVANAAPDGHTLFFGPNGQLTMQPHLRKNLPYKVEQVVPICLVFESPFAIVVRPDSPYKNFGELIEAARKSPGKVSYGLSGIGSVPHLLFHMVAAPRRNSTSSPTRTMRCSCPTSPRAAPNSA
jgi:tripartite-type tricarboxylate transporter receptor subunit TctC